ncbi:MAG: Ni/Fe hydrogenase subunit alpha [Planctomycetales bacterium]|nr:Ni/Fe hydrogenase subunit alpha [Planctomycetales bacterium]
MTERVFKVEALTRVEGEGGLYLRMAGDQVDDIQLQIYEPPRLFEALLRGKPLEETPDITARICGICPVAYQMSSVHALEAALGITISPEVRRLRRLLYCGEWIESHALHIYLLNAPDFLGYQSGLELAGHYPAEAERGLRMKKHGNDLLQVLGGRAIHPVNVAVGGFYRLPKRAEMQKLIPDFEWCLEAAIATTRWAATFDFPELDCDYQFVSLGHDDEYPMNEGPVITSDGERIDVTDYEAHFKEVQRPHSTAFHSLRTDAETPYLVGPLARVGLCFDKLAPVAREVSQELGLRWPSHNPFHSILARGLELIHVFSEGLEILRDYEPTRPARQPYEYRVGEGCAATEAPRGLLYHHYRVSDDGKIVTANIIPPTSQNQARIEEDLRRWAPRVVSDDDSQTSRQLENLVRCYDPCISCSTHFLKVKIDRQ